MSERGRWLKTEHAGAKNGGGFWGKRQEAKKASKKQRRVNDKLDSTVIERRRL